MRISGMQKKSDNREEMTDTPDMYSPPDPPAKVQSNKQMFLNQFYRFRDERTKMKTTILPCSVYPGKVIRAVKIPSVIVVFAVLAAVIAFAGCTTSAPPEVVITSPQDNATITGSDVTLNIQVSNFAVSFGSTDMNSMNNEQNQAGTGHIHWYMDVPVPTVPGEMAVTANGTWQMQDGTSYTWHNVQPGTHTFSVQLVNKDMTPLSPPVYQTITVITVPGAAAVPANQTATPVSTPAASMTGSSGMNMNSGSGGNMTMNSGTPSGTMSSS
jgi:hypothetical protein